MAHPTLHPVKPTEKGAGGFCHVPCCVCSRQVFGVILSNLVAKLSGVPFSSQARVQQSAAISENLCMPNI